MFSTPFGIDATVLIPALILVVLIAATAIGILIAVIVRPDDSASSASTDKSPSG